MNQDMIREEKKKKEGKEEQKFCSAGTSINSTKVPSLFKKVEWKKGTRNLDWGGGRYDTATVYMSSLGCKNIIYDPFNRTNEENSAALEGAPYDTVTISNVLNVIAEKEVRIETVEKAMEYLKPEGWMYIKVYEGDRSGVARPTKEGCWQCNRKTREYFEEIREHWLKTRGGVAMTMKNDIIIIEKGKEEASTKIEYAGKWFPQIGEKVTVHHWETGTCDPYTVAGIKGGKVVVRECGMRFCAPRYYDSLPAEIYDDTDGKETSLTWSPRRRGWILSHGGSRHPGVAEFGKWEYRPYLD